MVALVEDQQAEAVAPALQVDVGRVVGSDRQRLNVVGTPAHQADGDVEGLAQLAVPLVEQVDGGSDDQRWPSGLANGQNGDPGLAGAGRQHHDAAAALLPPCLDGFRLVRERLALGVQRPGRLLPGAGLIGVSDFLAAQVLDNGAVVTALGADLIGARVGLAVRQGEQFLGGATGEEHGAAVESQQDRWLFHRRFALSRGRFLSHLI